MRSFLFLTILILVAGVLYLGVRFTTHSFTEAVPATAVVKPAHDEITTSPERVAFVYQDDTGQRFRAMVEQKRAAQFMRDLSRRVEERKQDARLQIDTELELLFSTVFEDRAQSVTAYSDWFYTWGRPYQLIGGATKVVATELTGSALRSLWNMEMQIDPERAAALAEGYLQAEMMEAYTQHVLKPQHRDHVIETGVLNIVSKSYDRFIADLDAFDLELVEFLYAQDPNAQSIDASEAISIELSWDAAQFDAPRDRSKEVVASAATGATVLLGSAIFSAEISAVVLPVISTISAELMTSVGFATSGGILGSEVPVLGTIIGIGTGLTADYVINRFRERMTREEFEAETQRGLDATIARWKGKIRPALYQLNDAWYADVRRWMIPEEIAQIVKP